MKVGQLSYPTENPKVNIEIKEFHQEDNRQKQIRILKSGENWTKITQNGNRNNSIGEM